MTVDLTGNGLHLPKGEWRVRAVLDSSDGLRGAVRLLRHVGARLTAKHRMLPAFLVIGTKRGGSTSLYEYITAHPDVLPCTAKKGTHYFDVNFERGWPWFRSFFPRPAPGRISGEGSPYYLFHPLAAARIAAALPEVKLVAALRDPVQRAYSHYHYNVRRGFEALSLDEALDAEPDRLRGEAERMVADGGYASTAHRHHSYLARGRYAEQLTHLYRHIPPERVLLLQSEAMYADPSAALARVYTFLGLRPYRLESAAVFKSGSYEPIPAGTARRLSDYYAPHNAALATLPGVDFRWPYVPGGTPIPPQQTIGSEVQGVG